MQRVAGAEVIGCAIDIEDHPAGADLDEFFADMAIHFANETNGKGDQVGREGRPDKFAVEALIGHTPRPHPGGFTFLGSCDEPAGIRRWHQLAQVQRKRRGKPAQRAQGWRGDIAFDLAQIPDRKLGAFAQILKREVLPAARRAEHSAKGMRRRQQIRVGLDRHSTPGVCLAFSIPPKKF